MAQGTEILEDEEAAEESALFKGEPDEEADVEIDEGEEPRVTVKKEVSALRRKAPAAAKPSLDGRKDHELFAEKKRTEGSFREASCKAICKIKHGLRQPGAQEDGKPVIPENWESNYKPVLGSFIKFLLSRPDQFKIVEGTGPGFYTIEDVTRNRTVVAPVYKPPEKGAKGKEKGAKGKLPFLKGKGGKGFLKGKKGQEVEDGPRDFAALRGKGKGKAPIVYRAPDPEEPASSAAEKLLMQAARDALAAGDGSQAKAEDLDPEEKEEEEEEDAVAEEGAAEAEEGGEAETPAEEDEVIKAPPGRGACFSLLFGDAKAPKRPAAAAEGEESAAPAKRAR